MYPLNVTIKVGDVVGFAVANDEAEHQALTAQGYQPAFEQQASALEAVVTPEVEQLRAQLAAKGVAVDGRWGVARLSEELAKVA